ncbi:MAG TPA: sugar transferase, partial [Ktedonobacteraceae bacterium]|nr:sugar transferase [Ktedonobacteraceae bacterium]
MLLIALGIKLDDGGPILYFREIIGYQGKRFFALKFRTMILDAEQYLAARPELNRRYQLNMKLPDDPRITRLGRFLRQSSLDELPQLLNIFLGQMTLVGPRIIHPEELIRYGPDAGRLLALKPGLTGLWQISGRQHISYAERIRLDMEYSQKRSILLDLTIVCKTLQVFFKHTGM